MHNLVSKPYRLGLVLAGMVVFLTSGSATAHASALAVGCSVAELKTALQSANADNTPDTLELASNCLYTLTTVDNLTPDANGLPVLSTDITVNGNHATLERSTSGGTPTFRILQINSGAQVTLNALTLQGGIGTGGGAILNRGILTLRDTTLSGNGGVLPQSGGALWNDHGVVDISDSVLQDNYLDTGIQYDHGGGGAVASSGTLTVTNSLFQRNRSYNNPLGPWWGGGAILVEDGAAVITGTTLSQNSATLSGGAILCVAGTLEISNSHILANTATNGAGIQSTCALTVSQSEFGQNVASLYGGGIDFYSTAASISESSFHNNSAAGGGGIRAGAALVISRSTLTNNHADGSGGGISSSANKLQVSQSTFSENTAGGLGGGIYASSLTLRSATFSYNTAAGGGAVFGLGPNLRITHSTFDHNHAVSAGSGGGALYLHGGTLGNSTFSENVADGRGGAVWNERVSRFINVTLFKNRALRGASFFNHRGTLTLSNSLVGNGVGGENCAFRVQNIVDGGHNLDSDASCGVGPATAIRFDKQGLANNGGLTQTVGLQASSPAVDAGDDTVCRAAPVKARDQRGVKRPQGKHCDIGAFELRQ